MSTPTDRAHALIYFHSGEWYYRSWTESGSIHYDQVLTAGSLTDCKADLWRFVESDVLLGEDFRYRAISFATERPTSTPTTIMIELLAQMGTIQMSALLSKLANMSADESGLSDRERQLVSDAGRTLRS